MSKLAYMEKIKRVKPETKGGKLGHFFSKCCSFFGLRNGELKKSEKWHKMPQEKKKAIEEN